MFSGKIKLIAAAALLFALCTAAHAMDAATSDLCKYGTPHEVQQAILSGSFELDSMDAEGNNPLLLAAGYNRDGEVIRILAGRGYDIDCRNYRGATPLMEAALRCAGASEVIDALIEAGADVNSAERGGITPLMMAAFGNTPEIVELLLRSGADPDACDISRGTALYWANQRTDGQSRKVASVLASAMRSPVEKYGKEEAQFYYTKAYVGGPYPPPPPGNGEEPGPLSADVTSSDAGDARPQEEEGAQDYAGYDAGDEGAPGNVPQYSTPAEEIGYSENGLVKSEGDEGAPSYTVRIRRPVEEKNREQYEQYNYDPYYYSDDASDQSAGY